MGFLWFMATAWIQGKNLKMSDSRSAPPLDHISRRFQANFIYVGTLHLLLIYPAVSRTGPEQDGGAKKDTASQVTFADLRPDVCPCSDLYRCHPDRDAALRPT